MSPRNFVTGHRDQLPDAESYFAVSRRGTQSAESVDNVRMQNFLRTGAKDSFCSIAFRAM